MLGYGNYKADYCHWCGDHAKRKRSDDSHVFCRAACKMAHHRAYKKYVTRTTRQKPGSQAKSVTQKKRKK